MSDEQMSNERAAEVLRGLVARSGRQPGNPTSDALDAAIAALGGEPNMRHPKIQALISASARRSIELSLIESLLFDQEFEMAGSDWDYETALVTKVMNLRDKLALPAAPSKEGV